MQFLGRFRILTKVLAIVVLLSGIGGIIAYLGISALGQLSEKEVAIVRVLNRKLAFPDYCVDIEEYLGFLLALSHEKFYRCPIAGRSGAEPSASSLR